MKKILYTSFLSTVLVLQGFFALPAAAQTVAPSYGYPQQTSYCPTLTYNLYRGLSDYYTGGQVSQLQQFLAYRGYAQPVTGYYGSLTTNNVAQFQQQYSVYPVSGGVGPLTRAAIANVCNGGGVSTAGIFYLNQPFTLSVNQTVQQYNGQLDVTLNGVSSPLYTYTPYPGYSYGQSATITLGQRCQAGTQCLYYPTQQFTLTQGQSTTWQGYTVTLNSASGNSATFTVSGGGISPVGGVTVSSPVAGQTYTRGGQMQITWGYPVTPNSTQMALELYTASGSRVGLIAVSSDTSGSYTWNIPRFPQNYMCTMQYPNALCGASIPTGQYYIKVSATNNPLDSNPTVIASGQSGVFTILQQ